MFREAGVVNAAFVWCDEPSAPGDFDEQNIQGQWKWFPGDDVVDWFSIDWFNKDDFTGPLVGGRPGREPTAHGRSRKFLDLAVAHRKPVIVAESAPCGYDLADPQQAEAAWREWQLAAGDLFSFLTAHANGRPLPCLNRRERVHLD